MYRILKALSGKMTAECQIQDGTERAEFTDETEAFHWLIKSARVFNGDFIRNDDIERLDMVIVDPPPPSQEDQLLLEKIRRKELVVVPFDDKRLRCRITDAECDMLIEIREGVRVSHYKD